jgi:hypothetical protein
MASDVIHLILGYTILHFDIAIKNNGQRPENIIYKNTLLPDTKAEIILRKRESNARGTDTI